MRPYRPWYGMIMLRPARPARARQLRRRTGRVQRAHRQARAAALPNESCDSDVPGHEPCRPGAGARGQARPRPSHSHNSAGMRPGHGP